MAVARTLAMSVEVGWRPNTYADLSLGKRVPLCTEKKAFAQIRSPWALESRKIPGVLTGAHWPKPLVSKRQRIAICGASPDASGQVIATGNGVATSPLVSAVVETPEGTKSDIVTINGAASSSEEDEGPDFKGDEDLQRLLDNMGGLERRNSLLVKQMTEYTSTLADTARALGGRAQAARIEAAKLKKASRLQQMEALRREEEVRRMMEQQRLDQRRLDETRVELARRQQQLDVAEKQAQARATATATLQAALEAQQQQLAALALEAASTSPIAAEAVPAAAAASAAPTLSATAPASAPAAAPAIAAAAAAAVEATAAASPSATATPSASPSATPVVAADAASPAVDSAATAPPFEAEFADAIGPDAITLPETMECSIAHPGALSCTKTTIRKDPTRRSAAVTMTVTTRCAGDACQSTALDLDDYVALGVQALVETAQELKHSRFQTATSADPVTFEKHRLIVDTLYRGQVVASRPNDPPSKFGHESFIVTLLDRKGQKHEALFKPRVEGDADGWHRAPVEYVAYELNLMLGMDYVPPVAYRKGGVQLEDKYFDEGAMIYYVSSARPLRKVAAAGWGVTVARLLSDTRVLDVLLNNSDRHYGHFLYGEHWTDGKPRPVLIDHAAGFRKEAFVLMEHENAFQTGPVRCASSRTYLRLRFLEREAVASKFKGFLTAEEVDALMHRRDEILVYLDKLVQERGYHRTVLEI